MQRWVALFYSVILGPKRRVRSVELLEVARAARLRDANTVLSTGNLLGSSGAKQQLVERRLERAAEALLGRHIPVFCRSDAALRQLVERPPFPEADLSTPSQVAVRLMREEPSPEVVERIARYCAPDERFRAEGSHLWLFTPHNFGASRLVRAVNAPWAGEGTSRSLSALRKIAAALERS